MSWGTGLTEIRTEDLKKLLGLLHRGELETPLSVPGLTRVGLQKLVGEIDTLRGLNESGLRAVLVCVLAERRKS